MQEECYGRTFSIRIKNKNAMKVWALSTNRYWIVFKNFLNDMTS